MNDTSSESADEALADSGLSPEAFTANLQSQIGSIMKKITDAQKMMHKAQKGPKRYIPNRADKRRMRRG